MSLDKLTLKDNLSEHKKSPQVSRSLSSGTKIKNMILGALGAKAEKNGKKMDQKELLANWAAHVGKRVVTFVGDTAVRGTLRAFGTNEYGIALAGIELVRFLLHVKFKLFNVLSVVIKNTFVTVHRKMYFNDFP